MDLWDGIDDAPLYLAVHGCGKFINPSSLSLRSFLINRFNLTIASNFEN